MPWCRRPAAPSPENSVSSPTRKSSMRRSMSTPWGGGGRGRGAGSRGAGTCVFACQRPLPLALGCVKDIASGGTGVPWGSTCETIAWGRRGGVEEGAAWSPKPPNPELRWMRRCEHVRVWRVRAGEHDRGLLQFWRAECRATATRPAVSAVQYSAAPRHGLPHAGRACSMMSLEKSVPCSVTMPSCGRALGT
jgi:hypothetical protein